MGDALVVLLLLHLSHTLMKQVSKKTKPTETVDTIINASSQSSIFLREQMSFVLAVLPYFILVSHLSVVAEAESFMT